MTDNELLLAMAEVMDKKLEPIKKDVRDTRLILENDILPGLGTIESCYTSTYRRYASGINQLESIQSDVDILKKIVGEHSNKLHRLA